MSIEVHALRRVRVDTEPAGSFTTSLTIPGTFTDVPAIEGTIEMKLNRPLLYPAPVQQRLDEYRVGVVGPTACELSFSCVLASTGTDASNNVAQVAPQGLGVILAACMGGQNLGTGDTTIAGVTSSSPGTFTIPSGSAATHNFIAGAAVGFGTAGGGTAMEYREIDQVAVGDTVTIKNYTTAPVGASGTVRACASYYLASNPDTSLQFVVEGYEQSDRFQLFGCQLSKMEFELVTGELPKINFTFKGAYFASISDAALGAATYTNYSPIYFHGDFLWHTNAQSTATRVDVSKVTFEPNIEYIPVTGPNGAQNQPIIRWRRTRSVPVIKGSFTTYYEALTYHTEKTSVNTRGAFLQIGDQAGQSILLSAPTVQVSDVQREDSDGISGVTVQYEGREDGDAVVGSNTDLGESAFRIHFG